MTKSPQMTQTQSFDESKVWGVSSYEDTDGKQRAVPISYRRINQSRRAARRVFATFDITADSVMLLISLAQEAAAFFALEQAAGDVGAVYANVDLLPREAFRLASYVKQFEVSLIAGIDLAVVQALDERSELELLRGHPVLARPDALGLLRKRGFAAYAFTPVGPLTAVECQRAAGMHIDASTRPTIVEGKLTITVDPERLPIATGRVGTLNLEACPCGNPDPRFVPSETVLLR
jgi:hypothetical protein